MPGERVVFGAVEGLIDEAVLRRLVHASGAQLGPVYGKAGKSQLRANIKAYNRAAQRFPWVVLVDLDREAACGGALRAAWIPTKSSKLCFRVAVREVESWLMADRERFAQFLGISIKHVPRFPDQLEDPKQTLLGLVSRSPKRNLREDVLPAAGGGRSVGMAYNARLITFASDERAGWRPDAAAAVSQSLGSAVLCIRTLLQEDPEGPEVS